MTYSQLDLELIRIFGKKELSFGCILKVGDIKIVNKKAVTDWNSSYWRIAQTSCEDVGDWGPEYVKSDTVLITEIFDSCSYQDKKTKEYKLRRKPEGLEIDLSKDAVDYKILGHLPTLEDIFRVAEEKGFTFDLINFGTKQPRLTSLIPSNENFNIPYNPTLSPLEQSEETKQALISLFK